MPWKDESGAEPPRAAGGPWGGGSGGDGGGKNGGSPWNRPGGGGSGGSGGGGGDLEDQMRRMQERFRNRGGGGGGSRGQRPSFGPGGLLVLLGAGLLAWLATGIVIVDEGERAALFRFGEYQDNLNPGFHIRFPTPIETHEIMPAQRRQTTQVGQNSDEALMLTGDESIVDVEYQVFWRYDETNPEKFILEVEGGRELVKAAAESVMREVVGQSTLDSVITSGRSDIQKKVEDQLQALLNDYKAGVGIIGVEIQNAVFPSEVQDAYDDVVKAGQDKTRVITEANKYRDRLIEEAEGQAQQIRNEAVGYRDSVIADATGQASRFEQILAEYRKAPRVTRERMYLETMERVLDSANKLVLDNEAGAVPYLPIERTQSRGN